MVTADLSIETPRGFRDLYWCWLVNEPMILDYEDDVAHCPLCDWKDNEKPDDAIRGYIFSSQHEFIQHIHKPVHR